MTLFGHEKCVFSENCCQTHIFILSAACQHADRNGKRLGGGKSLKKLSFEWKLRTNIGCVEICSEPQRGENSCE